jgi:hypothetical protein
MGQLETFLPLARWTFLSVTMRVNRSTGIMDTSAIIDSEVCRSVSFPLFCVGSSPLHGAVGGAATGCSSDRPALVASIGVFHLLTPDEVAQVRERGPNASLPHAIRPTCFFVPVEHHSSVRVVDRGTTMLRLLDSPVRHDHAISLVGVLVMSCGCSLLLPLFAQWDFAFVNGISFNEHLR